MRVGVNSGEVVRAGDRRATATSPTRRSATRSTPARASRALAPAGGVLIGAETYGQLPDGTVVEKQAGLRIKGKDEPIDAYLLLALP